MHDLLIVGGGIAGLSLALACRDRGLTTLVFDDPERVSAAHASGGILNPITGKSFSPAWNASALFPLAHRFYSAWAERLSEPWFTPRPIHRFTSAQRARKLERRLLADPEAASFIAPSSAPPAPFARTGPKGQPLATMQIRGGATLDTRSFVCGVRNHLKQYSSFHSSRFCPSRLQLHPSHVGFDGHRGRILVFCEGRHAVNNPLFPDLILAPVHGEVLTLSLPNLALDSGIYIQSHWLYQLSPGVFRFGATYSPDETGELPTESGATRLMDALRALLPAHALGGLTVLEHRAGLRPATPDRLPCLGIHPHYPNVACLTGLGSKGCSLAPWLAHHLLDHWFAGAPVHPDIQFPRRPCV